MKRIGKMMERSKYLILIVVLAVISHAYVLYRLIAPDNEKNKIFMTGANDGLEQMLPMQLYLYEKFKEGTLFFDAGFGLGGDFYTDLAYYYSTNIVYYINIFFVRIGEFLFQYDAGSIEFWAYNSFFISILKTFAIIFFTYKFLTYIGTRPIYAVLGGFIFAASPTYFRFTIFWSFFSDVFIWLPLTLLALEVLIRRGKTGLFIFAVALTLINNFYFAYFQLIISVIYLLIRLIFRRRDDLDRKAVLKRSVPSFLLGFGISLVAFLHAVRGFLNNDSREYEVEVPFLTDFTHQSNIFYENYLVIIIFIAVQALFTKRLYRHYFYKLFAILTIVFMIFTLSPYIDTFFNGFQQPQKRWHYMLVFFHAVLIAQYLSRIKEISVREYLLSLIPIYIIIPLSAWWAEEVVEWVWLIPVVHVVLLFVILTGRERKVLTGALTALVVIFTMVVSASHTDEEIYHPGITDRNHLFYINSNHYSSERQKYNIDQIQQMKKPEQKVDFKVRDQDNTPMYMGFNGTSIYSSIINGNIIDFYYDDLKVNFTHESISRHSSFQYRSNLFSLFNADYMMRTDRNTQSLPTKFEASYTDGTYTIYENQAPLNFIRFSDNVYDPDDLDNPLEREHAMLNGVVTDEKQADSQIESPENLLEQVNIEPVNATYDGRTLEVHEDGGGLNLNFDDIINGPVEDADVYIEMHLELIEPHKRFTITVDDYPNDRLFADSKYRTYADDLLYRAELKDDIPITLSEGRYDMDLQNIFIEDYSTLEKASERPDVEYEAHENPNSYEITLNNAQSGLATIPLVYRDGVKVTGNASGDLEPFRANYLMTGFEVGAEDTHITISYSPPYYWLTLIVSLISLIVAFVYIDLFGMKRILKRLIRAGR